MLSNFFEPHYEDNNGKLWSVEKLLEMVSDWEDPNPKPIIEKHGKVFVVRDDLLDAGTKIRAIDFLISSEKKLIDPIQILTILNSLRPCWPLLPNQ